MTETNQLPPTSPAPTLSPLPSRLIGCARVSTYGQTLDAQLDQFRTDGATLRELAASYNVSKATISRLTS